MVETILQDIRKVYKNGDIKHILNEYVDKDYWIYEIKNFLSNNTIENQTDFNYSTCFTMCINISDVLADVGTNEFDEYIKNTGFLYRIQIQISIIGPYATFKYIKYEYDGKNINFNESTKPFISGHSVIGNQVEKFIKDHNLFLLNQEILSVEVKDVVLELKESDVTIYNCLFEDEY